MAVGADDIALGDLGEQSRARREQRLRPGDPEKLGIGVAMVEVHLVREERLAAVFAWHATELAEKLERRALSGQDAIDLSLAVPPVVVDVVRTLITSARHNTEDAQATDVVSMGLGPPSRHLADAHSSPSLLPKR